MFYILFSHLADAHMFMCLGMVEDVGLLQCPKLSTHVLQETRVDVVIEISEGDLLGQWNAHVVVVILKLG